MNGKVAYLLDDKAKPQNGTAKLDRATGQLTYSPNPGFIGNETFKYYTLDEARATLHGHILAFARQADPAGPWFLGERFSLVDVALAPWAKRLSSSTSTSPVARVYRLTRVQTWPGRAGRRGSILRPRNSS